MLTSGIYIALIIGIILSLIFAEYTGVLPSGLIVPGYIALVLDEPRIVLLIFVISILTYFIVTKGIARVMILYGRRKFAMMLTVGIALKLLLDNIYPLVPFELYAVTGIGLIVPGLIANNIQKQGFAPTLLSTLFISGLTFVLMIGYYAFLG